MGKRKKQSKHKKTNKLSLMKPRNLATDAHLKALDDVIYEVASQQELPHANTEYYHIIID